MGTPSVSGLAMGSVAAQSGARLDRRVIIGVCFALTALVWIVFGQTLTHDFVNFDDDVYVYDNPHVSAGLTVDGLKWVVTHSHASLWHPLTTLTHMADAQLYGLKPRGHHFTNVLLHNIGAVLLFLVLQSMTGRLWRSAFVAAIFAIHPMRVESVAWVAERKDVMSGAFLMLTLWAYMRYARAPTASPSRTFACYLTVTIFLVCGLMSKATFVTVPFVLLLLDYWPLRRADSPAAWRPLFIEKIPLVLLSILASLATIAAQTVTIASLDQLALLPRLKNAAFSAVIYLRKMFWPTDLAIFYPHPHDQLNLWLVLGAVALLLVITSVAIVLREKRPYVIVGWFWYLVLVFPVLGIVQAGLQGRADRFTYLPHIGITLAVTWTCADVAQRWRNGRLLLASLAVAVVLVCTALSYKQTTYWRDSITIWRHALSVTADNQTADQNLAAALYARGQIAESHRQERAGAIAHAKTVLNDFPYDVPTRDDLGVLLVQTGDPRGAIEQWEKSLELNAEDGNALNNLAWVLATYPRDDIRNGKQAAELAEKATQLPGGNVPLVIRTLAAAYAEAGDFVKAADAAQRAIDLARSQSNQSLVGTLQHELELYRARTPYRESPPE